MRHLIKIGLLLMAVAATSVKAGVPKDKISALNEQLQSLAQQVERLSVNQNTQSVTGETTASPELGKLSFAAQNGGLPVMNEINEPFEELPSTTFELALLKAKHDFPSRGVAVGGYLELNPQTWQASPDVAGNALPTLDRSPGSGSGIFATTVNLDFMSNVNDWTQFFASFKGANLGTSEASLDIFNKAFITVGDLDKLPVYMTVGKIYLPFAVFGGNGPWSDTLAKAAYRSSERTQLIFGYFNDGFNAAASVLNGNSQSEITDMSYNLRYDSEQGPWHYGVGGGYLLDIRGLSSAYGSAFSGSTPTLQAGGAIGVYDFNAKVSWEELGIQAEYLQSVRGATMLNPAAETTVVQSGDNLGRGSAWYLSMVYTPKLFGKDTEFQLTYSGTDGMAGVPIGLSQNPDADLTADNGIRNAWVASVTRTVLPMLYVGLEFQASQTYAKRWMYVETLDFSVYF